MTLYRLRRGHLELLAELAPIVARKANAGPCMHDIYQERLYWTDLHARLEEALRAARLIQHDGTGTRWYFPDPSNQETTP